MIGKHFRTESHKSRMQNIAEFDQDLTTIGPIRQGLTVDRSNDSGAVEREPRPKANRQKPKADGRQRHLVYLQSCVFGLEFRVSCEKPNTHEAFMRSTRLFGFVLLCGVFLLGLAALAQDMASSTSVTGMGRRRTGWSARANRRSIWRA